MTLRWPTSRSRTLAELEDRIGELVGQLEPVVLTNCVVGTTETAFAHGLGEVPGWVGWDPPHCIAIVKQTRAPTKTCIYLQATVQCVVNIRMLRAGPLTGGGMANGGYHLPDWDPAGTALGDHKVSVDATDEAAVGYDYLLAKLSNTGNVQFALDTTTGRQVKATVTVSPSVYDFPVSIPGALTSGGKLWRFKFVRAIKLPASATGSYGNAGTAALLDSTVTLKKTTAAGVTTTIGTVTVAAGATAAVFTVASEVSFAADDVFWGENQAIADAQLADLALTFKLEYA